MAVISFKHPQKSIKETTRITEKIAAAGTTLKVRNTEGMIATNYIILGKVGSEHTEIVKITTVTNDTQFVIAATKFAHSIDDLVSFTQFNKIQFGWHATAAGTPGTTYTAVGLEVDDLVTEQSIDKSTGYFYARFYNDNGAGTYSSWSEPIPVTGFTESTLRHIIDMARLRTQELDDGLVTDDNLLDIAKECSDEIETVRKNWSFVQKSGDFDMTAGVMSYATPSDLAGYESVASFYLGYDGDQLDYVDIKDFNYELRDIPRTKTTAQITSASSTINVKDTSAFGTTGTLACGGDIAITHTGKTHRSFTGVSGVVRTHTASTEVFVTSDLDQPTKWTIWENKFKVIPVPDTFYNCNHEYYRTIPRITTMTAETVVPMPSLFIWYLMAEIYRMRKQINRANFYAKKFEVRLDLLTRKNRHGQILKFSPAKSYFHRATIDSDAVRIAAEHGD